MFSICSVPWWNLSSVDCRRASIAVVFSHCNSIICSLLFATASLISSLHLLEVAVMVEIGGCTQTFSDQKPGSVWPRSGPGLARSGSGHLGIRNKFSTYRIPKIPQNSDTQGHQLSSAVFHRCFFSVFFVFHVTQIADQLNR